MRLSTNQTSAEKTSVTAKLIDPFIWEFSSDTDIPSAENEEEQITDDSPLSAQMYDSYRTYEQTKADIQNGYIVNTGASFSERVMPTVTGGGGVSFYVNHDNTIDISIILKNLIDGTGHIWTPDSFVSFEVYDPSGKVAYSFYKEGAEIQDTVDIDTELAVYPGEWRYNINFAYTTNGTDPSDMRFALKYKTIYEDDEFRVILDLSPATKGHALILPKNHYENIYELDEESAAKIFVLAKDLSMKMKGKLKCEGLNIVQNNGEIAGQTVFHFHMHLLPRYKDDGEILKYIPRNPDPKELEQIRKTITD